MRRESLVALLAERRYGSRCFAAHNNRILRKLLSSVSLLAIRSVICSAVAVWWQRRFAVGELLRRLCPQSSYEYKNAWQHEFSERICYDL